MVIIFGGAVELGCRYKEVEFERAGMGVLDVGDRTSVGVTVVGLILEVTFKEVVDVDVLLLTSEAPSTPPNSSKKRHPAAKTKTVLRYILMIKIKQLW